MNGIWIIIKDIISICFGLILSIRARKLTRLPWIMSIDDRNDAISQITTRVPTCNAKPKCQWIEGYDRAQLWKRENDIKTKLRPFGKEITKSMFPQERSMRGRERERQGSCTLSTSTRKKYNNCCYSLSPSTSCSIF
jgi:hypothetical protein